MKPDYPSSIEFLQKWRSRGPWVLTAVAAEGRGIETRTFKGGDDLSAWLEDKGTSHNIYFSVNPVMRDVEKKAAREDIAEMAWLHVDIDPRHDETPEAAKARALAALKSFSPPPQVIVDSGGGIQAFWRLIEPLEIQGKKEAYEEAKRYNKQLEIVFGGDNCHNVDRIMRVPGTINRPNARKRQRGRVQSLAQVIVFEDGAVDLSSFTKACAVQEETSGAARGRVELSGNVARLSDVEELARHCRDGAVVEDWLKTLIVQGNRADHDEPFPSRSEALFAACCSLVRLGVEPDVIYAVITDADFGISSSVLDKGGAAEKYATRQIERAMEEADDPWLRKLNDRFAVIGSYCGKCVVIEEDRDDLGDMLERSRVIPQTFEAFKNRFLNKKVQVGVIDDKPRMGSVGKWWLEHPDRREYETLRFSPGRDLPGVYNLWRGFTVEARPGDCSQFLEHIRENVCGGDDSYYDYLMGWMATAVQHPDRPGFSAVVLQGTQGTGKSFFVQWFGRLWGRHFLQISDASHLVGKFNAHLEDCSLLYADEAFWAGDKNSVGALKRLVTEETMAVERKGMDVNTTRNYVHLMIASNEDWVVPADADDRRFFVLKVGEKRKKDTAYFKALAKQMGSGGLEALLHVLLTYDLSGFDVRTVPKTEALRDQKRMSLSSEAEWWFRRLQSRVLHDEMMDWTGEVPCNTLMYDYATYCRLVGRTSRGNSVKLGHFLKSVVPDGWPKRVQRRVPLTEHMPDGKEREVPRPWYYLFPSLDTCRAAWEACYGAGWEWPEPSTDDGEELFA